MKLSRHLNLLTLGTVMVLAAGCAAPTGRLQITAMCSGSLKANPKDFQRLAIVPIWFTTSAYAYSDLTRSELTQMANAAGQETAAVLASTITNRGYQVVGNAQALCCEDDLAAFDAETLQLLDEVRVEFWWLTQNARAAARAGTLDQPFRYKLKAPLLQLQHKLGVTQADALVLVDSTVLVETPAGRWKRLLWNWTVAPAVAPVADATAFDGGLAGTNASDATTALGCPATIEHTIAIVDPRTSDVLMWASVVTPGANVRESVDLRVTIFDLLSALPLIGPPSPEP
ncbi:MAG: hypothetical protein WAO02_17075 [Verrucomicrobiia bacterium]